jgi:hypothetical protein
LGSSLGFPQIFADIVGGVEQHPGGGAHVFSDLGEGVREFHVVSATDQTVSVGIEALSPTEQVGAFVELGVADHVAPPILGGTGD